ncbi:hypothetical protein F5888DRAFT_293907 [Russula emetica]|nr:hypothetical protein F5888DRAFT_293907 [Russula emetica]
MPSYLCTSPQFPSEFLSFPPDSLVFLEPFFFFFFFSFGLQYPYSYLSMAIAARRGFSAGTMNGFGEQSPIKRSETFLKRGSWEFSGICGSPTGCPGLATSTPMPHCTMISILQNAVHPFLLPPLFQITTQPMPSRGDSTGSSKLTFSTLSIAFSKSPRLHRSKGNFSRISCEAISFKRCSVVS